MAQGFQRHKRVAGQIQREMAELIRETGVDTGADAPLTLLTITGCEVSRDLAHAKIFYSVLNANEQSIAQDWFEQAASHLRGELGHRMRLRIVPHLTFVLDTSIEHGMQMDALIDSVREQERSEQAESDDENPAKNRD